MSRPSARLCLLRMLIAVAAASIVPAWPGLAQAPGEPAQLDSPNPDSPNPESRKPDAARPDSARPDSIGLDSMRLDSASLDSASLALDRADATFKREGLSVQALFDLGRSLNPLREELQAKVADLEPRLAEVDAQLKQLGPAPAQGAPPESAAIAAERARLAGDAAALDVALKQARLLAARADDLAAQITERRRSLYARQLLEPSPSVLSPFVWLDAAKALAEELGRLGELMQSTWASLRNEGGLIRGVLAALTLAALGIAMAMLWRWWQRRIVAPVAAPTRFAKALASTGVFLLVAVTAPLVTLAAIEVLEAYQLLPGRWIEIAYGLGIAVAIAAFGRAIASGALAPDAPWRRLVALDDEMAAVLARHLVWAARALGALVFALVLHKILDAPPVLVVASNMLFALVIGGLLLHLLLSSHRARMPAADEAAQPALWLRAIAWLALAVIVTALVAGYGGLAAFVAERLLSSIAVLGVLYLLVVLTNASLVERLGADTPKSRAIAVNFGVNPRRLGLLASLLSGGICLLLIVAALVLIIGPLEFTPADFGDTLRKVAFGFRIGDISVSFGAVFTAAVILLAALVIARALQSWLERQILPRTELEPSLQHSIAAVFGYVGVIAAIVLALSQLGIDLQKVTLIAGALSVGIGFGLQSIVSNFISGLILLAERPIRVGDLIVVKGEEGYVRRIRVRATEIETFERASVIIPNAEFITGPVKNWTHSNTTGRIIVKVGVGYDSDPDAVRDILIACADEHPRVLKVPASRALLLAFGDSALEFELRAYVDNVDAALVTRSDLNLAILRRFRAAGIVIPYPQREVRIRKDSDDPAGH
jgi:potassium efflux system protein